jgi:RNA polymerase sigma-70 factor, ECF subfamily
MDADSSDEHLLECWLLGEAAAFEAFFKRHSPRVTAYAARKDIPKDELPEVVQDVFLKLHNHIDQYEPGRRALPWFFTLVHYTCLDHLKRGGKSKLFRSDDFESALGSAASHAAVEDQGWSVDVNEALRRLSADTRRLLDMRLMEELSFEEMSAQTGKSEVALRKAYSRAVQNLRSWIGAPRRKSR